MKFAAALALIGFASAERSIDPVYAEYVAKHNKSYLTEEEYNTRKQIFAETHYTITQHNKSGASHTLAHNEMSDWTQEERERKLGRLPTEKSQMTLEIESQPLEGHLSEFNWQDKLASMRRIKNQGACGSCWAFSAVGSVEAAYEIATGKELNLSEQELVDCAHEQGSMGCDGGLYEGAFQYLQANGSEAENAYGYTQTTDKCEYDASKVVNHCVVGQRELPSHNTAALVAAIKTQPVSISIQANQSVYQFYSEGVIADDGKCGTQLDHAVLAIGFGNLDGQNYVLVRNSWGADWGVKGTVKLGIKDTTCACGCVFDDSVLVKCHA